MATDANNFPLGNFPAHVASSEALGRLVRAQRKRLGLTQNDVAGLGGTGNRFLVDLENGKPTVQLQKVLDLIDLLGLELVLRPKGGGVR